MHLLLLSLLEGRYCIVEQTVQLYGNNIYDVVSGVRQADYSICRGVKFHSSRGHAIVEELVYPTQGFSLLEFKSHGMIGTRITQRRIFVAPWLYLCVWM